MLLIAFVVVFLLDQLSKMYIMNTMLPGYTTPVISGVFHITYIQNRGAAFGLMADQRTFFILISLLVIIGILIFHIKHRPISRHITVAMGLVAGGAAGNMLDRLRFGGVVDFIDFRVWPIFNLADTAIVIGAYLLALALLRSGRSEE